MEQLKKTHMQQECLNLTCTTQNKHPENNLTATNRFSSYPVLPKQNKKQSNFYSGQAHINLSIKVNLLHEYLEIIFFTMIPFLLLTP